MMQALLKGPGSHPARFAVDHIGALFESRGETLKSGIEHRSHQHRQHPAFEFVREIKPDFAFGLGFGFKTPAILEAAERPLQIFDENFQIGTVQRHLGGEGFAHQLERYRHIGNHNLGAVGFGRALTYFQSTAQRHEFRVALDVSDKIEHLRRTVVNPALAREFRHRLVSRGVTFLSWRLVRLGTSEPKGH